MDRIEMSGKEIKRLEVLRRLADGVLSQREAEQRSDQHHQSRRSHDFPQPHPIARSETRATGLAQLSHRLACAMGSASVRRIPRGRMMRRSCAGGYSTAGSSARNFRVASAVYEFQTPFLASGRVPMDLWVVNDTIRRCKSKLVMSGSGKLEMSALIGKRRCSRWTGSR